MPDKSWIDKMIEREATPKTVRLASGDKLVDFIKEHNISEETYYYQARKEENQKKILGLSLSLAKSEVPEILKVLTGKAKKGDNKSIEMYLDYIVKLAKNLDIKSDGKPIPLLAYALRDDNSNKEDNTTGEEA